MEKAEFIHTVNRWSKAGVPYVFAIDYEQENFILSQRDRASEAGVFYNIRGEGNMEAGGFSEAPFDFHISPLPFEEYERAFNLVQKHINHGNSFLLNLTFPTGLQTRLSLEEIFHRSSAPYKFYLQDSFVVFSPECFVKIIGDYIYAYPMKGTMDATIPGAESLLLNDLKELSEHHTIVDLIRNDLSLVSKQVEVTRFRYIDRIKTHKNELLQVSSEIRGKLEQGWQGKLGEILLKMLPAGSISGAPKRKTMEIIRDAEGRKRGFFTGIFGYFDGVNLDTAVMIRFIESKEAKLQFRSGGGITGKSDARKEYEELLAKVYVPIV